MSALPLPDVENIDGVLDAVEAGPPQGEWSEAEYLSLTDGTNRRIEFVDGRLEFLPMPTEVHAELLQIIYHALCDFVSQHALGKVRFNGTRLQTLARQYRFPDVLFLRKENFGLRRHRAWAGVDLAIEIVSDDPKDRKRDYVDKLDEYAQAGVAEYWIVDPADRVVIIHKLVDGKYAVRGRFIPGDEATSALLEGFSIDVQELFASIDDLPE